MGRTGHASVNPSSPRAFAVCDRCGMVYNHKRLMWQNQWNGPRIHNLRILVCESCLDKPQEQLRTMVIPADPVPIDTPRPEQYPQQVTSWLVTNLGERFLTLDNELLIVQYQDTLTPDPNNPALYP